MTFQKCVLLPPSASAVLSAVSESRPTKVIPLKTMRTLPVRTYLPNDRTARAMPLPVAAVGALGIRELDQRHGSSWGEPSAASCCGMSRSIAATSETPAGAVAGLFEEPRFDSTSAAMRPPPTTAAVTAATTNRRFRPMYSRLGLDRPRRHRAIRRTDPYGTGADKCERGRRWRSEPARSSRPGSRSARSCRSTRCSSSWSRPRPSSPAPATPRSAWSTDAARGSSGSSPTASTPRRRRRSATCPRGAASSACSSASRRRCGSHDLADDPRSVGFPPGHPPMHTFLGVPILLRGVAYGNLYLTEKAGGADFTEEDEELVDAARAQAAVAIENARLYEAATAWSTQLESLNEVGERARDRDRPRAAARPGRRRLRELLERALVRSRCRRRRPRGSRRSPATTRRRSSARLIRGALEDGACSNARRSERVDSVLDDPEVDHESRAGSARHRRSGCRWSSATRRSACSPRTTSTGPDRRFSRRRPAARRDVRQPRRGRRRPLGARRARRAPARRRRAGARAAPARARAARRDRPGAGVDPARPPRPRGGGGRAGAREALAELRELVRRDAAGRPPARRRAAAEGARRLRPRRRARAADRDFGEQTGIAVDFAAHARRPERLPAEVATALYRIVQEALTNIVKHARRHAREHPPDPQG